MDGVGKQLRVPRLREGKPDDVEERERLMDWEREMDFLPSAQKSRRSSNPIMHQTLPVRFLQFGDSDEMR